MSDELLDREEVALIMGKASMLRSSDNLAVRADILALCRTIQRLRSIVTHDDLRVLRESADSDHAAYEHHAALRSLADRLAALLPP